jgi:hypothetical protein
LEKLAAIDQNFWFAEIGDLYPETSIELKGVSIRFSTGGVYHRANLPGR